MQHKTYSFTFSLTFVFTTLLALSFSTIILYNYYKTAHDIYQFSENVNQEIRKSIIDKIVFHLDKVATHIKILSQLNKSTDIMEHKKDAMQIMWEQLLCDETIASIFIADKKANFIQVRRKPEFATRVIEKYNGTRMEFWEKKTTDYATSSTETFVSDYDPTTRDWYKKANKRNEIYWSEPYIFSSTKKSGITLAYADINAYGEKIKVTAADITLGDFSKLLARQGGVVNGDLILLGENQEIIATSFYESLKSEADGKILKLADLPEHLYGGFRSMVHNKQSGEFKDVNGNEYIFNVTQFPKNFNKKWQLITFVKKEILLANARTTVNNMLLMTFVIMVFFISLIIYIARKISTPITNISKQMYKLKDLDLDIDIQENSKIQEVLTAQSAIVSLRSGLESFSKYMPSELVRILIQTNQQAQIGGGEKHLAVMFTDIENFTTISEQMSPQELMVHLSDYFEALVPLISHNQGTVDKYIGDAILAFWGAPLDIKEPCLLAVLTAIQIQENLEYLNKKWAKEGKPEFKTRIGIHYGPTLVGNIGSCDRLNYTIIGDSVNIASRLEGINKNYGTNIIISQSVLDELKDQIPTRYIDSVLLKGKTEAVKIYTIEANAIR